MVGLEAFFPLAGVAGWSSDQSRATSPFSNKRTLRILSTSACAPLPDLPPLPPRPARSTILGKQKKRCADSHMGSATKSWTTASSKTATGRMAALGRCRIVETGCCRTSSMAGWRVAGAGPVKGDERPAPWACDTLSEAGTTGTGPAEQLLAGQPHRDQWVRPPAVARLRTPNRSPY